jgi:hypothetical protein
MFDLILDVIDNIFHVWLYNVFWEDDHRPRWGIWLLVLVLIVVFVWLGWEFLL